MEKKIVFFTMVGKTNLCIAWAPTMEKANTPWTGMQQHTQHTGLTLTVIQEQSQDTHLKQTHSVSDTLPQQARGIEMVQ